MDTSNFTIAIVGYVIVFTTLVVLYFVFANIPKLLKLHIRIKLKKKDCEDCFDEYPEFITGQENAVIATAIYLYLNQLHDEESAKMTIKKVKKDYSPWSSRVHSIHTFQR
ncbi:MAG: OadG family protein [Bacteroidales bacterium]|nr:OadG family protein [Bacteroidales bacterium]